MAFTNPDDFGSSVSAQNSPGGLHNMTTAQNIVISPEGETEVNVPGQSFITNAVMTQDGGDLILESPDGITLVIEGYFSGDTPPNLVSDGKVLSPALVKSFIQASAEYAEDTVALNDVTPIGQVHEVSGNATVTRENGMKEAISKGTSIYEGDIVETDAQGAVNIQFVDESSFAVSNNAKMAIDEFVYDPSTHGGENNFSMLRGLFVYTSGLVGREDPDDVKIETPVGSIGIRGTIITGSLPGEGSTEPAKISVVEGAIVITGRDGQDMTLSQQFETIQIDATGMKNIGVMPQADMATTFNVLRTVAPTFFSAMEEAQQETETQSTPAESAPAVEEVAPVETAPAEEPAATEPKALPEVIHLNLLPNTLDSRTLDKIADRNVQELKEAVAAADVGTGTLNASAVTTLKAALTTLSLSDAENISTAERISFIQKIQDNARSNSAPVALLANHAVLEQPGHTDGAHSFDISQFFRDADGNTLNYTVAITSDPSNLIATYNVDANGLLNFTTASTAPANINTVTFSVTASDGSLDSTPVNFSVDIYKASNPNVEIGVTGTTLNTNNQIVFASSGDDSVTILSTVNNTKVYGESGIDNISILGGTGNLASGGEGDDLINISNATNYKAFGGTGNDTIIINGSASLTDLLLNNSRVDGGTGFDTLRISNTASINLSNISGTSIIGIEKLQVSFTGSAVVTLDIQDIFRNGSDHALYLDVDGNDTVQITNTTGRPTLSATGTQVTDAAGETYNVYSNGVSTLYLSADANMANVSGL